MTGDGRALRLDDVGAASKRHEVYGLTRIPVGPWALPFPGNFLFLKYLPPIKRWGPYRELTARDWDGILEALAAAGSRMTVAITAGWVERDGSIVPFPGKFPEAAAAIRTGVRAGLLEVANHGYTHCVLRDGLFRPRAFSGNRTGHREFYDWLPEELHREHLGRAQEILSEFFATGVVTLVPPGNAFSGKTLAAAVDLGIRYVSCLGAGRTPPVDGLTFVDDADLLALHDRDVVCRGTPAIRDVLARERFVTVRELGERLQVRSA
jgi:hypothetical protein